MRTAIGKMELVLSPPKIPAFVPSATTCSSHNNHNKLLMLPNTALTNSTISASRCIATNFIHGGSNPNAWSGTSRATTPSPPSPPDPDKIPTPPPGDPMTLSRFKDVAQVFVGVLFWMGVFFWASAWDGRDNGKSDKGSRFRR
ncbi:E3 ubiquitin-protein like [Heracleum sosnowskyi]|uniref:E3 ubiquitin-protein like n=1 Tax=Heracleum sosnowskyi TaxID=360622 RepID=A0AAD8HCZ4_9APIA|nr:E3 ubiquitin-protein like [Heracleum sosnowskyi]